LAAVFGGDFTYFRFQKELPLNYYFPVSRSTEPPLKTAACYALLGFRVFYPKCSSDKNKPLLCFRELPFAVFFLCHAIINPFFSRLTS